ncbi:MAG TPA: S-layer homology domain-containing protein [Candidatus Ornithomonoglobus intestinigallinarum]|uniref:S-layer homology domain-containing protein n=1 Tax=Candidatus Ornithomonoglobus intestinigallinarum TaxID=2840894 RepID=A0A9D1H378_9FIRM|nr:S-layer homology domain-containing protein [Candidatus Ornithomonoglobus intestinigallinarum]
MKFFADRALIKKSIKAILITVPAAAAFFISSAYAGVLGDVSGGWTNDMGAYSVFHKTEFDGGSGGHQTEYYVEYVPNTDAVPIIAYDGSLWGQSNINDVAEVVENNGNRVVAGINGDFFSFKTGLPMGTSISGGEILSKLSEGQYGIGFRSDGTAFIDYLEIKTTAEKDGVTADVECINKWYQAGFDTLFMLTDDFGSSTKTEAECIFVIASPAEGTLAVDSQMTLTAEEKFEYDGEIAIPDGKYVLVIDKAFGREELKNFVNALNPGDTFTITNEAVNSEKGQWATAAEGTTSTGSILLKNGEIGSGFEAGAAPRTAVGIRADGTVIMYVLDGRQEDYSYGAQLTTLAKRMLELGCVDALNLDGGGSTTMGALLGGTDSFGIMNRPSDGYPRSVANFIFLKDNRQPTGEPWLVDYTPLNDTYYLGDTAEIVINSIYDTANYKTEDTSALEITAENAEVLGDGRIYFNQIGSAVVRMAGGIFEAEMPVTVHRQYFGDIQNHWAKSQIEAMSDAEIVNGSEENGTAVFRPDSQMTRSEFAAIVSRFAMLDHSEYEAVELPFEDADAIQPWAVPYIKAVYGSGIMNGKSDDNGLTLYFDPESPVTRAEAMTMLGRILSLPEADGSQFADSADIPDWARDGIERLTAAGIVNGYEDNTIRPNNTITRAEGAVMMYQALGA